MIRMSKNQRFIRLLPAAGVLFCVAFPLTAQWVNVTANLADRPSECGNLCLLSVVPGQDKIIAGIAQRGLWQTTNGGATWTQLGQVESTSIPAAEPTTAEKAVEARSTGKGQWVAVHEGTGGVTVDRVNGDVYIVVTGKEIFKERGQGVWKSTDQGATFARVDGNVISGRCETGYGLCHDPNGNRLYCFMLDGPRGYTLDAGKTWVKLGQVNRGRCRCRGRENAGALEWHDRWDRTQPGHWRNVDEGQR
jgi:hypothetical protein